MQDYGLQTNLDNTRTSERNVWEWVTNRRVQTSVRLNVLGVGHSFKLKPSLSGATVSADYVKWSVYCAVSVNLINKCGLQNCLSWGVCPSPPPFKTQYKPSWTMIRLCVLHVNVHWTSHCGQRQKLHRLQQTAASLPLEVRYRGPLFWFRETYGSPIVTDKARYYYYKRILLSDRFVPFQNNEMIRIFLLSSLLILPFWLRVSSAFSFATGMLKRRCVILHSDSFWHWNVTRGTSGNSAHIAIWERCRPL